MDSEVRDVGTYDQELSNLSKSIPMGCLPNSDALNQQTERFVSHLKRVDPIELTRRIQSFKKLNTKDMNEMEIRKEIYSVLLWDNLFLYQTNIKKYPKGTIFFRIRKLNGSRLPISNFQKHSDFWEPPTTVIKKPGRLNKAGESLLYTTPGDPSVPLLETHIQEGEFYALIHYVADREVKVNLIGGEYDYSAIGIEDKTAILVHELYNDFLLTEFSRDVGEGTEFLYRVSEIITKDFFDLPPRDIQDAWAYSSVQDKKKYNVCFRPDIAHEILHLKGAMICKKGANNSINVYCVALPSADNSSIGYYQLGSDKQKEVFPDIILGKQ